MADGTIKILCELATDGLKTGLKTATKMIAGAAAALGAMGAAAIKTGIDWESAFAGVKKTVDATDDELNALSDGLRDLSHEIPTTASGLAEIAEAAGQLGIKTENILSFTETMANLGVATNLSATEAASSLAKFANITGMSQTNFDRLGSTIVALGNNLATTEADIVSMSMRIAGAGRQVGLSEAQIMSFSGALSSVGIEAEAGGTAFSTLISKMSLACAKGGDKLNQFASVAGMSATEFKTAFEQDASGAILAFIKGLNNISESGGSAIGTLDEMELSDIRMRDALLRAAGASDVFTEALDIGTTAWKENTALAKEASQRYETVESKIQLLKNSAQDLGIELYASVQEPIKKIVTQGIKYVNQLTTAFKKSGFSGLTKEVGNVLASIVSQVTKAAPKIVRAAVGMIDGLLSGIKQNLPKITKGAIEAGLTFIDGLFSIIPDIIDTGLQLLSSLLKGFGEALPELVPKAVDALVDAIVSVVTNIDTLLEAGGKIVAGLLQGILNAVPKLIQGFSDIMRNLFGMVSESEVAINESLDSVRSSYDELTKSISSLKESASESNAEINATCAVAQPWIDRLTELENKSSLTADEQAEWNELLGKLKTAIPEISDLINDQTGEINGGTQALTNFITQWKNYAKAKVYAEMAEEGIRSLIDAEEALTAADNAYSDAKKSYNTAISDANNLIAEMTKKYPELAYYQGQGVQSLYELRMAIDEYGLAMGENAEDVYAYEQKAIELANIINGLGGDFMDLSIPVDECGGVLAEHRTAVADLKKAYDDANATVDSYYAKSQEFTQAGDEMANAFELSTGKVVKSKDEYTDALTDMYVETKDSTLKTALELKSLGKEADDKTKTAASAILENFSGLPENLQQSGKDILLGLIGGMDNKIPELKNASKMSADELVKALKDTLGIHSPSTVTKEIGQNTMTGLKNGISENAGSVIAEMKNTGVQLASGLQNGLNGQIKSLTATAKSVANSVLGTFRKVFDIHSPSKATKTIGAYVSEGLAEGVKSRKKVVQTAVKDVAETATESIEKAESAYKESAKNLRESNKENLKKLSDDHKDALAGIKENYKKSLESIQKSQNQMANGIVNFAGLFEAPSKSKVIGVEAILENARAQTEQVKEYTEAIEALRKRGISQEIIDELVDLGPKSAEQLKTFNSMTDEQLQEYLSLRAQRQKDADTLAKKQYADERAEAKAKMQKEILEENAAYEERKVAAKQKYQKDLAELKVDLEKKLNDVGAAMKKGLINGAKMSTTEAKRVSDNLTSGIIKQVKKELGIASPSKVFAEIGRFSSAGLGLGFIKSLPSVMRDIERSIDTELSRVPMGALSFQVKSFGHNEAAPKAGATYNITNNVESPVPITVAESAREANRQTENTLFKLGVYGV